jgi:predicted DNA-binding transcriptional regulator AlpA
MQAQLQPASLTANQAATYIGVSERHFHLLRKTPAFPKPRVIGSRNRWLRLELDQFIASQPFGEPRPEPQQLSGSAKHKSNIEPRPEVWPMPRFANPHPGMTSEPKAIPRHRRLADHGSAGELADGK